MALTITIPGGPVQLSDNRIRVIVNTDTVTGSLYQVLLKVTSSDDKLAGGPFIDAKTPDASGNVEFDISGYVWRDFVPDFSIVPGVVSSAREDSVCKISLDIGESYVDASSVRQENWAGLAGSEYELTIIQGGISEHKQNIYNDDATTWYADYIQGGKWLTSLPNPLVVSPSGLVKLGYMTPEATEQTLVLTADYILQDGTTGTATAEITAQPGKQVELNVDPVTLGIPVSGDNPAVSYEVYLLSGETRVTEKFGFQIDYTYYEFEHTLLYLNQFGCVDTLWLHGQADYNFPAEHETAQRIGESTDTVRHRTRVVTSKSGRRKWSINLGYRESFDEIIALQHLILSAQVWLIVDGRPVPVNIEESEELLGSLSDDLHEYTLELTEAHSNRYA